MKHYVTVTSSVALLVCLCAAASCQPESHYATLRVPANEGAEAGLGTSVDGIINYDDAFQRGRRSWTLMAGACEQHNLPTGPRSDIVADGVKLRYSRFAARRRVNGLQLSYGRMHGAKDSLNAYCASGFYQHYYSVKPKHAAWWGVGAGVVHLDKTIRELGTHTNFVEYFNAGFEWAAGDDTSWLLEYEFTHMSNAGRKDPNTGLNSSHLYFGHVWYH